MIARAGGLHGAAASVTAEASLERAAARVREGVGIAARRLESLGVPVPALRGRLLRPLVAYAAAPAFAEETPTRTQFWSAVLAVQMAHEASLLHDDVIDGADMRRGEPSVAARAGTPAAIVMGDHLLTGAYRAATLTHDLGFITMFARAVERTVAGERRQAALSIGDARAGEWREVLLGKSGELFGCALATGAVLGGGHDGSMVVELGRRVGLVYQMLDDLLDYCPGTDTGKAPFADYRARRWTWPLADVPDLDFGCTEIEVSSALFGGAAAAPARRALARLEDEVDRLTRELACALGPGALLQALLEEWRLLAREAIRGEQRRVGGLSRTVEPADRDVNSGTTAIAGGDVRPPSPADWTRYLNHHSRSFAFASSLMPAAERHRIAAVYAWCRHTDDLVDVGAGDDVEARLDDWLAASRAAYDGTRTGIEMLDAVMGCTREAGVPFTYAAELIAGMRMDLRHRPYADLGELRLYTWRAAGTVGLWLAELHGVQERWALERAAALGQAMQLTNIVRDVGEDLARGRLYLPLDRLHAHGLTFRLLRAARERGERLGDGWRALLEELMSTAEHDYRLAAEALPVLPAGFRRAAAVASAVYAGIHDAVRRIDHDTLHQRAATTMSDKLTLAARALIDLGARRRGLAPSTGWRRLAAGSA